MNREINKKKVTYTLPEAVIKQIKEESGKRKLNMSVIIQLALEEYFRKEGNKCNE